MSTHSKTLAKLDDGAEIDLLVKEYPDGGVRIERRSRARRIETPHGPEEWSGMLLSRVDIAEEHRAAVAKALAPGAREHAR